MSRFNTKLRRQAEIEVQTLRELNKQSIEDESRAKHSALLKAKG